MLTINPLLAIDAYKFGHMSMHPDNIDYIYCNLTPRSMKYFNRSIPSVFVDNKLVAFGMQMTVQDIIQSFDTNFFSRPLSDVLAEFLTTAAPFIGENAKAKQILESNVTKLHKLGYLPLCIKTLPEGTISNPQVPILTIVNTIPGFGWLPNYLETYISQNTWKVATVATLSRVYRKIFEKYSALTCDDNSHILFQGHDFSARGMSSTEDSIKDGIGHLTQFWGSDSVHSAFTATNHYGFQNEIPLAFSVPATEHSIMQVGIALSSEEETFRRLLEQYNTGIIAIVSDTEDYWNTITNIASNLKDDILARQPDSMGLCKTVFRPDSGNPVDIVCGVDNIHNDILQTSAVLPETSNWDNTKWASSLELAIDKDYKFIKDGTGTIYRVNSATSVTNTTEAEVKGSIECLWDIFGGTINDKGYKVLNPKVGLIYGDSITPQRAKDILAGLATKGFASSNIVFGIGSYAYNYSTRDSLGFAIKATAAIDSDDNLIPIQKTVKTDTGKKSACGLLHVTEDLQLIDNATRAQEATGALKVIFSNGSTNFETNFAAIRERAGL
jgi:nicotinamide phosphoribosyltransferase